MSSESPRERALTYGSHVGDALAQQHIRDAQNILPVYAEQSCVTLETRRAMTVGMWSAYMTALAAHVLRTIGPDATRDILRMLSAELTRSRSEDPSRH